MIKKHLVAATLALTSGGATAADLPRLAPPPILPLFTWTGAYIGVSVGVAATEDRNILTFGNNGTGAGALIGPANTNTVASRTSPTTRPCSPPPASCDRRPGPTRGSARAHGPPARGPIRGEVMNVMIVEDERRLGLALKRSLATFHLRCVLAETCAAANDALSENSFDAVVLDINLPDGDGFDIVRDWRACGFSEPVIILSARGNLDERIRGLNLGADDYLAKPFSVDELVARLRAIGRRNGGSRQTRIVHGALAIDLIGHVVQVDGTTLDLTGREYALMEIFLRNPGRILTRSVIQEAIWHSEYNVDNNLIDVYMSRLRNKIEFLSLRPVFRTIRGVGYQLL